MKQKIVVSLLMNCDKCRRKALGIAVCIPGVESAGLKGEDKNQVEVVGDRIDSVELTRRLRKEVAHAELVSVDEVKKEEMVSVDEVKKEEKEETDDGVPVAMPWPSYYGYPPYYCYEVRESPTCIIM